MGEKRDKTKVGFEGKDEKSTLMKGLRLNRLTMVVGVEIECMHDGPSRFGGGWHGDKGGGMREEMEKTRDTKGGASAPEETGEEEGSDKRNRTRGEKEEMTGEVKKKGRVEAVKRWVRAC